MTRVYPGICGAAFGLIGLVGLIQPLPMLAGFGYDISGAHAMIESRAMHGGVFLIAGTFMIVALFRGGLERPAPWFVVIHVGGLLAGRAVSLVVDGPPRPYFWGFIGFEILLLVPAIVSLRDKPNS